MGYREITKSSKDNIGTGCVPFCVEKVGGDISDSLHIHDFHQLTVITRGSALLVQNGASHPVRTGDVYVIGSFSAHCLKEARELEFLNVLFYLRELEPLCGDLCAEESFRTLFYMQPLSEGPGRLSNFFSLDYSEINVVNRIVSQLLDEQSCRRPGRGTMIQSAFLMLIVCLCRAYRRDERGRRAPYSYQLHRAVQYMEENCGEPIAAEELALRFGVSYRQLRQLFVQEYACTPLQYLLNLRIRKACYYLVSTDLPITEISAQTGFEDNNYFSRKFRQLMGVSPRDYRRSARSAG